MRALPNGDCVSSVVGQSYAPSAADRDQTVLAQQIVSGLATGSLYALTAIGIVLIFRNTRTINLAQGDFSMIGAFIALAVLDTFRVGLLSARPSRSSPCPAGCWVERLIMRRSSMPIG